MSFIYGIFCFSICRQTCSIICAIILIRSVWFGVPEAAIHTSWETLVPELFKGGQGAAILLLKDRKLLIRIYICLQALS